MEYKSVQLFLDLLELQQDLCSLPFHLVHAREVCSCDLRRCEILVIVTIMCGDSRRHEPSPVFLALGLKVLVPPGDLTLDTLTLPVLALPLMTFDLLDDAVVVALLAPEGKQAG